PSPASCGDGASGDADGAPGLPAARGRRAGRRCCPTGGTRCGRRRGAAAPPPAVQSAARGDHPHLRQRVSAGAAAGAPPPGGAPQSEDPTVQPDENEIAGVGTACVTPNIGCVGKRMDPQSWEKCPDLVFVQSHVAQAVGGTISYDQNCDVAATTNPPPPTPGTTWSAALFEHFQIPLTPTWFKNL